MRKRKPRPQHAMDMETTATVIATLLIQPAEDNATTLSLSASHHDRVKTTVWATSLAEDDATVSRRCRVAASDSQETKNRRVSEIVEAREQRLVRQ